VILCTVGLEFVAVFEKDFGHGVGVGSDLFGVGLESWVGSLFERDSDTRNGLRAEVRMARNALVRGMSNDRDDREGAEQWGGQGGRDINVSSRT
jgi:hypothetical protein